MALNFPGSPVNGQAYQGFVYNSSVQAWQSNPASVAPFYTADTPPTNPTKGDSWFNTNDGTMYIYVNDGTSSQWVEHRSEIARSQVGLVPIVPTSVAVGSGTASVNVNGLITFTNADALTVNGVFSNTYKFYKIFFLQNSNSVAGNVFFRFATAGTQTTGTLWYFGGTYWGTAGNGFVTFQSAVADFGINTGVTGYNNLVSSAELTVSLLDKTSPLIALLSNDAPNGQGGRHYNGRYNDTTGSYDGFRLSRSTGTYTGTVKIYGYN